MVSAGEPSARDLYKKGRKLEKAGNFTEAYLLYAQAAAADPSKREYWLRSQALRTRAAKTAGVLPSGGGWVASADMNAETAIPAATAKEIEQARQPQPPFELKGSEERKTFDLRGDNQQLFEQVAKAYGLDVVFDGDYTPGTAVRFQMENVDYREALYALMTLSSSFIIPVGDRLFMVAKDTDQKRRDVEVMVAVSVPIPEPVALPEVQELARSVQQLMEIHRFGIDSAQRIVVIRDRLSKVRPAVFLLYQLLHRRAQIFIEAELISVAKTSSVTYGIPVPTSFPLQVIRNTLTLRSGSLGFAVGIASAEALANASSGSAKSLLKAEMRTVDGVAAQFHAGDKYPIQTVSYIGDTSGSGQVYTPPPSFNFEDLGLILKITPKVHDAKEVSLDIESEFKLLGTTSFNGIPVIANRKFATRVRLGFDEAAVIGGLVTSNSSKSVSGLAGIINIPILGDLLSRTTRGRDDVEILLVLKAKLLDLPSTEMVTKNMWIGTEGRLLSPL